MTSAPDEVDPLTGTPYRRLRRLGGGAAGEVFEAEHVPLAKRVVVKLLREAHRERADLVDRMRVEAQALARLSHPHLVSVLDFGQSASGRTFLVLERLEGRDLAAMLGERGRLSVPLAVELARQALDGLSAAHALGLVHRDVKPENLFVVGEDGPRPTIKVLDFGVAKVRTDLAATKDAPLPPLLPTGPLVALGTPRTMAPEQASGGAVDARTDVYAVGCVLYAMLAGKGPFDHHATAAALLQAHLAERPEPPSRHAPEVPEALDALVLRALAKRPDERFPSAADFRDALAKLRPDLAPRRPAAARPAPAAATIPGAPLPLRVARGESLAEVLRGTPRATATTHEAPTVAGVRWTCLGIATAWLGWGTHRALSAFGELAAAHGSRELDVAAARLAAAELAHQGLFALLALGLVLLALVLRPTAASVRWIARWSKVAIVALACAALVDLTLVAALEREAATLAAGPGEPGAVPLVSGLRVAWTAAWFAARALALVVLHLRLGRVTSARARARG